MYIYVYKYIHIHMYLSVSVSVSVSVSFSVSVSLSICIYISIYCICIYHIYIHIIHVCIFAYIHKRSVNNPKKKIIFRWGCTRDNQRPGYSRQFGQAKSCGAKKRRNILWAEFGTWSGAPLATVRPSGNSTPSIVRLREHAKLRGSLFGDDNILRAIVRLSLSALTVEFAQHRSRNAAVVFTSIAACMSARVVI